MNPERNTVQWLEWKEYIGNNIFVQKYELKNPGCVNKYPFSVCIRRVYKRMINYVYKMWHEVYNDEMVLIYDVWANNF